MTPSTNPPQFRSSHSAGSHVPGKAVLSKAEAGKRKNIKNLCPILSCRQGVARHCPLGSCRSCLCPWETPPAGQERQEGGVHPSADVPSSSHSIPENPQPAREVLQPQLFAGGFPSAPHLSRVCHKVITTDLEKASPGPSISHPWLQGPELSPAAFELPDIAQPQDPPEKPILPG